MGLGSRLSRAWAEARLSGTAKAIRKDRLTYLSPAKLVRLEAAAGRCIRNGVVGDFLEFGVALGGSSVLLAGLARRDGRRFVGFDVFGLIPPPASEKDDEKSKARYSQIAGGGAEGIAGDEYYGYQPDLYSKVCRTLASYGQRVDGQNVQLVQGLFEETWPQFRTGPVALAHVDCDWYDPVFFCLEKLAPLVSLGGVIVLDDYNDYGGCRIAADEFLATHAGFSMRVGPNPILERVS